MTKFKVMKHRTTLTALIKQTGTVNERKLTLCLRPP